MRRRLSGTVVRAAEPDDVERLIVAYEWLFAPPGARPPGWNPRRATGALRRTVASPAATVLMATRNGELVGFCTAYDDIESVRFGRGVWVEDLAVHPEHRSQGIGKQLLDEAKRWGRARAATRLQLTSGEARTSAHRFYEREHPDLRSRCFSWRLPGRES